MVSHTSFCLFLLKTSCVSGDIGMLSKKILTCFFERFEITKSSSISPSDISVQNSTLLSKSLPIFNLGEGIRCLLINLCLQNQYAQASYHSVLGDSLQRAFTKETSKRMFNSKSKF